MSPFPADRDEAMRRLATANQLRSTRAALKRRWAEGARTAALAEIAEIVASRPPWARSWRIGDALRAVPHVGRTRIADFCLRVGVDEADRIGEFPPAKRQAAVAALRRWAGRAAA